MEIKELQKESVEIIENRLKKSNLTPNIDLTLSHLVEEFGEIAFQINNGKMRRKEVDVHNIGEEISDCIILLMMLSKQYNIDIESALVDKMEEIKDKKV